MIENEIPKILTSDEVAEILKISRNQVQRLARQGKIPATRRFGAWRFTEENIVKAIKDAMKDPYYGREETRGSRLSWGR